MGTPIFVVSIATLPPKVARLLTSNGVCKINILLFSSDFYSVLKMKQERPKLCAAHSLMLKAPKAGQNERVPQTNEFILGKVAPKMT